MTLDSRVQRVRGTVGEPRNRQTFHRPETPFSLVVGYSIETRVPGVFVFEEGSVVMAWPAAER